MEMFSSTTTQGKFGIRFRRWVHKFGRQNGQSILAMLVVYHPSPHPQELLLYGLGRTCMIPFRLLEYIQHGFLVCPFFELVAN